LLNQQKIQKNHISPKIKLQWINDTSDIVNYLTHNDDSTSGIISHINNKSKRE